MHVFISKKVYIAGMILLHFEDGGSPSLLPCTRGVLFPCRSLPNLLPTSRFALVCFLGGSIGRGGEDAIPEKDDCPFGVGQDAFREKDAPTGVGRKEGVDLGDGWSLGVIADDCIAILFLRIVILIMSM